MTDHLEIVDGGTRLLTLRGELDAHDAPRLRSTFAEALAGAPAGTRVVLDLAQVSFMDSTVLGSIVGLLRRIREADGELRVVLPGAPAVRIFEITGLDALLATYPTRTAAIQA
ncbi:MAG: STAS domain-containing protein [Gaiella sp.]|nr:STAS domain-containing protein [Gaiella sp.]